MMDSKAKDESAASMETLGIAPKLAAMLVCPIDKGTLSVRGEALECANCGRSYPGRGGIPELIARDPTTGA